MEMIDNEEDEERLLILQREQESIQIEETNDLNSMIAYLQDNSEVEEEDYDNADMDGHEKNCD